MLTTIMITLLCIWLGIMILGQVVGAVIGYKMFKSLTAENKWGNMITYEVMQRIEGDTEKHSNYELVQYEFPFPENSVLIERDKEMNRILNKPIIITTSNNNNCQQ